MIDQFGVDQVAGQMMMAVAASLAQYIGMIVITLVAWAVSYSVLDWRCRGGVTLYLIDNPDKAFIVLILGRVSLLILFLGAAFNV